MKKLSVLALFLMLFGFQAEAQVKIGYTNPEVILSQLPEVQSINQEIGDLLERKDSLLAIQALALQKELEDYSASKDVMTLEQRQQKEQDLIEKNQKFFLRIGGCIVIIIGKNKISIFFHSMIVHIL